MALLPMASSINSKNQVLIGLAILNELDSL